MEGKPTERVAFLFIDIGDTFVHSRLLSGSAEFFCLDTDNRTSAYTYGRAVSADDSRRG
jgi:hypothetical protein